MINIIIGTERLCTWVSIVHKNNQTYFTLTVIKGLKLEGFVLKYSQFPFHFEV